MNRLVIALLFVIPVSWGCTAYRDIGTAKSLYDATPVCCADIGALKYDPIKVGTTSISLDEKVEAFAFPQTGKSYFKAFVLPQSSSPLEIVAHSSLFQNGYPSKGIAIFFPRIMLLDQGKNVVAVMDWVDDKILHPGTGQNTVAYVETHVDLSAYPAAKYMVIYTDGTRIGTMQDDLLYDFHPTPIPGGGALPYLANTLVESEQGGTYPSPAMRSPIAPDSLSLEISAKN